MPTMLVVALLCGAVAGLAAASAQARAVGAFTKKGAWSFWSAPGLHPPILHADKPVVSSKLATGGYFMTANFYNLNSPTPLIGQSGPMILNNKLQPVWFRPVGTKLVANNLSVQKYLGQPVLAWWQGVVSNTGATLSGQYVVVDQHYNPVATLTGKNGWVLSLHDFQISGQDAWVSAYKNVSMNLTSYGGLANGTLVDFAVQEYDLKTGQLLGTWDALHNVPLSSSKQPASKALVGGKAVPWDAYHGNSIELIGGGQFLVSLRNTWTAYLVNINKSNLDQSTFAWKLSGNPSISSFQLPTNAGFRWQHDVELLSGNRVTVFDDSCCAVLGPGKFGPKSGPARGLLLQLNLTKHTGALVAQYTRPNSPTAYFLGSMQELTNGNALVGWGSTSYFTEFNKSGKTLLDVKWPGPDLSYRTLFEKWVGTPSYSPSGVVRKLKGKSYLHASWNGATRVVAWRVLAGSSSKHLTVAVERATKTNFDTTIQVPGSHTWFEVEALGNGGKVLDVSKPFTSGSKPPLVGGY